MPARTHGMYQHPAYSTWEAMWQRCRNPKDARYKHYGGRGIKVCQRWAKFEAFWADMGAAWQFGLSLDRIDNDSDYKPGNCRWATHRMQARNSQRTRMVDTPSGRLCLKDAARLMGIPYNRIMKRLHLGWKLEDVLLPPTPMDERNRKANRIRWESYRAQIQAPKPATAAEPA